ncbi:hypothetical protein QE412_001709 [Microbacterium trichothecenolyticum]|uniref:Uncharacterized protein n=1 Tax=Microbacterium trichothecenolyticum TaxID=69370 RepID=A0ABU0TTZ2_MICTR|nr:hypothetical protein [Microbacterium trichothecenolyticum]
MEPATSSVFTGPPQFAEQRGGRDAGIRELVGIHAPHPGDVPARFGVADGAVAGQLVGLLAVFASALAVALAGEGAVARALAADEAEHEREVDRGGRGGGAVDVLFDAASGEDVRAARGEAPGRLAQQGDGDAGGRGGALGPPLRDRAAQAIEARRPLFYIRAVGEAFGDDDVGEPEQQRQVGAGRGLQVGAGAVFGEARGGGAARVDDDEAARGAGSGEVREEGRHGRGDVGAEQQDGPRVVKVGDGEGESPVHAEGPVGCRGGRRHAESAVVVDARGAERDAGELAQLVRLLVGESAAAEDGVGVGSVCGFRVAEGRGHGIQCLIPGGLGEGAVGAPHERHPESVGGCQELRRRPALGAESSPVGGEVAAGDRRLRVVEDGHGALQRAVRAVGVGGAHGHQMRVPLFFDSVR